MLKNNVEVDVKVKCMEGDGSLFSGSDGVEG